LRNRWWVAPGVAAAAALLAACGSSSASGSGSTSGSGGSSASSASGAAAAAPVKPSTSAVGLKSETTAAGSKVLTTAQGFTVYMFAIDTPTKSNCNATCLTFWPALTGMPSGAGLSGTFGTIKGTGGITQATYDGHPLYLFVKDTKPGQISGNGVNTSGGLWYALTPSGTKLAKAPKPVSSSSAGGSGGYGY
jgi:predicted lipoprotein with Yx(FWY)xxD motif